MVETLLALQTESEQIAWLNANAPRADAALVTALQSETQRLERDEPTAALRVTAILQTAATLWQDDATGALARRLTANALTVRGDFREALPHFVAATERFMALAQPLAAAEIAAAHSGALQFLGRYAEAKAVADSAEKTLRSANAPRPLANLLLTRGAMAARQTQFAAAQTYLQEARTLFEAQGDQALAAMAAVNEANVLTELNQFRSAEPLFEAAQATFTQANKPVAVARTALNLAYLASGQGDMQLALQRYAQARELFATQGNRMEVANVDLHRSDVYLQLNLWHEVLEQTTAAEPIFSELNMVFELGRLLLNRAVAQSQQGIRAAGIAATLRAARGYFSAENNPIWQAVTDLASANLALHNGDILQAQQTVAQAQALFDTHNIPNRLAQCAVTLGEIALMQNDPQTASAHFHHGLATLASSPIPSISYRCHDGLGRAAQQQNNRATALVHFRAAIIDIERLQAAIGAEDYKIAFLSDKIGVYERLIALALTINTPASRAEAFQTVERAKSRALLDTIARERDASSLEDVLLSQITLVQRELNWFYNRLNTPRDDEESRRLSLSPLNDEIASRESQLQKLLGKLHQPDLIAAPTAENRISTVTLQEAQQALPEQTLLLEFFTIGEQIIVFAVTATEPIAITRLDTPLTQIQALLQAMQLQLNKFHYGKRFSERHAQQLERGMSQVLQALHVALWQPLDVTVEQVIIVPHGPLHAVPFQALFDGAYHLVEAHCISYAPSATLLARSLMTQRRAAQHAALVIGVADPTIPHAVREAETVAQLFGDSAELRTGNGATVHHTDDAFAVLHLATHATYRSDNPQFSALKLADRWLAAHEISTLNIAPALVTLSACETGRNHIAAGDELVGLCSGFFAAGAQALAVSLWSADDEATAELMTTFYNNILQGMTANQALRQAQLVVKAIHSHPYYWAAFMLTGRPDFAYG